MTANVTSALEMQELFDNQQAYHGICDIKEADTETGKVSAKMSTVASPLTAASYIKHLSGQQGIGLSPLGAGTSDTIRWAAIDLDKWDRHTHQSLVSIIYRYDLPFCPCYSKSKNIHLYVFFSKGEKPREVRSALQKYAQLLDLPLHVEIFPKQDKPSKSGNWINLPYFNSERQMLDSNAHEVNIEQFIARAKNHTTTVKALNELWELMPYSGAPHCVRTTYLYEDTPKGTRNNVYYNACVYWQIREGQDATIDAEAQMIEFAEHLHYEANEGTEVVTTRQGVLRNKSYGYACNSVSICIEAYCKKDTYGISQDFQAAILDSYIYKLIDTPPSYKWCIGNRLLHFNDEAELIDIRKFRELVFREFDYIVGDMKQREWFDIVTAARGRGKEYDKNAIRGFSTSSQLDAAVLEFLRTRTQSQRLDQIYSGRLYYNPDDRVYTFKTDALLEYIHHVRHFKGMSNSEIGEYMRERFDMKDLTDVYMESICQIPADKVPEDQRDFLQITYEIQESADDDF
jgi:hypothetical protein